MKSRNKGSTNPNYIHGMRHTPEYMAWEAMINRCQSKIPKFARVYADRGITVCDRWRRDFMRFYLDMGPRPSEQYSLDRIDNDRGYFPENCRWATIIEQNNNRRSSVKITWNGRTQSTSEWAREVGTTSRRIIDRIRRGYPIEIAMSMAPLRERKLEAFGHCLTIAEWSERTSMNPETIRFRLKRGWTPEQSLTVPSTRRKPHQRKSKRGKEAAGGAE